MQQREPAVDLDVEHQVVLALRLVGQEVADLEAGAVKQHVDAAAAELGDRASTAAASVRSTWCQCGLAAGGPDRLDRIEAGPGALDARQLALDELRGRALAALLDALGRARA